MALGQWGLCRCHKATWSLWDECPNHQRAQSDRKEQGLLLLHPETFWAGCGLLARPMEGPESWIQKEAESSAASLAVQVPFKKEPFGIGAYILDTGPHGWDGSSDL